MNERTDSLLRNYKPKLAVVVYSSGSTVAAGEDYYLESHAIDDEGRLLAGQPLKQETIQGMVDIFFQENKSSSVITGLMPANLLKYEPLPGGNYDLIWYRPAERRQIFFANVLHIPSGKASVPALVYRVVKGDLRVYALASDQRPGETTQLHFAPFHNVGNDGGVCLGSAKAKKPIKQSFEAIIKYWEDMFWLSEFTHHGNDSPTATNLNMIWKGLMETEKPWPTEELKPTKTTLKNLL